MQAETSSKSGAAQTGSICVVMAMYVSQMRQFVKLEQVPVELAPRSPSGASQSPALSQGPKGKRENFESRARKPVAVNIRRRRLVFPLPRGEG
jgi:hypothetical protein